MKLYNQVIRVVYPRGGGRIVLRTDDDWNMDVEAVTRPGSTTKLRPVSCRNAQAANRGKISHAQWASEYRRHGIISRWRRIVLSRLAMAGGLWQSCLPI